ncbi:MAG: methylated-DNA--[protein]-cysteine S-methyltransferase [Parachlamydiales bacterium]|jgi:methylated-DNA-[protein]-cysteine S-methyltransferase
MTSSDLYFKEIPSPVGTLKLVANDQSLIAILWENDDPMRVELDEMTQNEKHPMLLKTEVQLNEYFAGTRTAFDLPFECMGTEFQIQVWSTLYQVPFGTLQSYEDIAIQIGRPKAVRAVGTAVGKNPLSIIVPCHRIVRKDGLLTGFAGSIEVKEALLAHEKISFKK